MEHQGPREVYLDLGEKIDTLGTRAPRNETLHEILKVLYTPDEADLVARMPYGLSTLKRVSRVTGRDEKTTRKLLESLAVKGLVIDIFAGGEYRYMPSPMVIGIFEFTMMRTRGELDYKTWARLFHHYLDDEFFGANFGDGQVISLLRALPHEGSVAGPVTEVLDYEKATAIVDSHDTFAIGTCSCRNEKKHNGTKECKNPLDTCSTFGYAADYWIRNKLAKKVSRSQMRENIARSRELGLVFCADNVKNNVTFICHCCKCCCNALAGIGTYGYARAVTTSNYIAALEPGKCNGCGLCAKKCPVNAIEMRPAETAGSKRPMTPVIDESFCLGCGVCALACRREAIKLHPRPQRVLHPENVFEKVILGALERDVLHFQIFDDPGSVTQAIMRAFIGGFLRIPPVKRALMGERLRSRFLSAMRKGVAAQGKGWMAEL